MVISRQTGRRYSRTLDCAAVCCEAENSSWRRNGDLQSGVICRRCNAKAVNLASGEVRCGDVVGGDFRSGEMQVIHIAITLEKTKIFFFNFRIVAGSLPYKSINLGIKISHGCREIAFCPVGYFNLCHPVQSTYVQPSFVCPFAIILWP